MKRFKVNFAGLACLLLTLLLTLLDASLGGPAAAVVLPPAAPPTPAVALPPAAPPDVLTFFLFTFLAAGFTGAGGRGASVSS